MGTFQNITYRFWSKVDIGNIDDCWNWMGGINSTGRGVFGYGKKSYKAHRVAWMLEYGEIPHGMLVCHKCDNGKCCNPRHLFLGSYQDNVDDMIRKGRKKVLCGSDDPKSILNEEQVKSILEEYIPRVVTQEYLAKKYCVSRSTILQIVLGRNWKHVSRN